MFYTLRKARNDAVHMGLDSQKRAGALLHLAFNLCCWLMEVYGDWTFNAPEYQPPEDTTQNADFVKLLQAQEDKTQEKLKEQKRGGLLGSKIKWNFEKFLISREGEVVARYGSTRRPEKIANDIEKLL